MEEPKPCPFCGGKAIVVDDNGYGECQVTCNCDAEPCITGAKADLNSIIQRWNRRAG